MLGKEEIEKVLFKEVIFGEIEDIFMLSLEWEIDENDLVVSDYGIICDVFVEFLLLDLDYKKVIGKRFWYFVL